MLDDITSRSTRPRWRRPEIKEWRDTGSGFPKTMAQWQPAQSEKDPLGRE